MGFSTASSIQRVRSENSRKEHVPIRMDGRSGVSQKRMGVMGCLKNGWAWWGVSKTKTLDPPGPPLPKSQELRPKTYL